VPEEKVEKKHRNQGGRERKHKIKSAHFLHPKAYHSAQILPKTPHPPTTAPTHDTTSVNQTARPPEGPPNKLGARSPPLNGTYGDGDVKFPPIPPPVKFAPFGCTSTRVVSAKISESESDVHRSVEPCLRIDIGSLDRCIFLLSGPRTVSNNFVALRYPPGSEQYLVQRTHCACNTYI
jgi:hypothetical protein